VFQRSAWVCYHVWQKQQDPEESIRLIRAAIDRGITFMDNCWDYNGGISEVRMGQALPRTGYRQKGLPDDEDRRQGQEHRRQAD